MLPQISHLKHKNPRVWYVIMTSSLDHTSVVKHIQSPQDRWNFYFRRSRREQQIIDEGCVARKIWWCFRKVCCVSLRWMPELEGGKPLTIKLSFQNGNGKEREKFSGHVWENIYDAVFWAERWMYMVVQLQIVFEESILFCGNTRQMIFRFLLSLMNFIGLQNAKSDNDKVGLEGIIISYKWFLTKSCFH